MPGKCSHVLLFPTAMLNIFLIKHAGMSAGSYQDQVLGSSPGAGTMGSFGKAEHPGSRKPEEPGSSSAARQHSGAGRRRRHKVVLLQRSTALVSHQHILPMDSWCRRCRARQQCHQITQRPGPLRSSRVLNIMTSGGCCQPLHHTHHCSRVVQC